MTPFEQYRKLTLQYPGSTPLIRVGDFYETFEEDAILVSRICGLKTVTMKPAGKPEIKMVGFPASCLEANLSRLVRVGIRVSVVEYQGN